MISCLCNTKSRGRLDEWSARRAATGGDALLLHLLRRRNNEAHASRCSVTVAGWRRSLFDHRLLDQDTHSDTHIIEGKMTHLLGVCVQYSAEMKQESPAESHPVQESVTPRQMNCSTHQWCRFAHKECDSSLKNQRKFIDNNEARREYCMAAQWLVHRNISWCH